MATRERPHAVNGTEIFLSMLLDELEEHGRTLAAILDRLPAPTESGAGQPAQADGEDTDRGPKPVQIAEPAPAAPKKRQPAKKTTGKGVS